MGMPDEDPARHIRVAMITTGRPSAPRRTEPLLPPALPHPPLFSPPPPPELHMDSKLPRIRPVEQTIARREASRLLNPSRIPPPPSITASSQLQHHWPLQQDSKTRQMKALFSTRRGRPTCDVQMRRYVVPRPHRCKPRSPLPHSNTSKKDSAPLPAFCIVYITHIILLLV